MSKKVYLSNIGVAIDDSTSLSDIAKASNTHLTLLCKYTSKHENNRSDPKLSTLARISDATGIPLKRFIIDYIPEKEGKEYFLSMANGHVSKPIKGKEKVFYTDVFGVLNGGIDIDKLSKATGIDAQILYLYGSVNNKKRIDPTLKTLKKISDGTGIPLKRFICDYIPTKARN